MWGVCKNGKMASPRLFVNIYGTERVHSVLKVLNKSGCGRVMANQTAINQLKIMQEVSVVGCEFFLRWTNLGRTLIKLVKNQSIFGCQDY